MHVLYMRLYCLYVTESKIKFLTGQTHFLTSTLLHSPLISRALSVTSTDSERLPRVLPRLRPSRLSPGDALDLRHERTASGAPSASFGHHGVRSSLQKRHQVCSARVRQHNVFDNLAPLAEHSADILVPPHRQTPAQCGFSRSHLLVICAAKPRYTAAAAREHRRVLAPRLPTPGASGTSPLHVP